MRLFTHLPSYLPKFWILQYIKNNIIKFDHNTLTKYFWDASTCFKSKELIKAATFRSNFRVETKRHGGSSKANKISQTCHVRINLQTTDTCTQRIASLGYSSLLVNAFKAVTISVTLLCFISG